MPCLQTSMPSFSLFAGHSSMVICTWGIGWADQSWQAICAHTSGSSCTQPLNNILKEVRGDLIRAPPHSLHGGTTIRRIRNPSGLISDASREAPHFSHMNNAIFLSHPFYASILCIGSMSIYIFRFDFALFFAQKVYSA